MFEFCRDTSARPKLPARLFFAVMLEPKSALQVARLADDFIQENALKGSRIRHDRLHVSLHHVGDYKRLRSATVYAARLAGDGVAVPPCEVTFQSIGTFGAATRPLVLLGPPGPLAPLYDKLGAALRKNGLQAAAQFTPHITLLYGDTRVPMQAIAPIRIAVTDFVLIHSERGLTKYNLLQRWAIDAPQALAH